jgi:hypothetical protein
MRVLPGDDSRWWSGSTSRFLARAAVWSGWLHDRGLGFSAGEHGGSGAVCARPTIMGRSVEGMRVVSEGTLSGGLPYLRLG